MSKIDNKNIVNMQAEINSLKESFESLRKEFDNFKAQTKEVAPSPLVLKQMELASVEASSMKPDAKAKKMEKIQSQIEKLQKKAEPKAPKPETVTIKFNKEMDKKFSEILGDRLNDENKEELKKKFRAYAKNQPVETWGNVGIDVHMQNFMRASEPEGLGVETPEDVESKEDQPDYSAGGGAVTTETHEFLVKNQNSLKVISVGVYDLNGNRYTGPARNDDNEDLDEETFDGETFLIDKATGRVYNGDQDDPHFEKFLGYARINKKKFAGVI